jgi:hypothetical protein
VAPILANLRNAFPQRTALEEQLLVLLNLLHAQAEYAQGYGPANVLVLLLLQRGHLRGLDPSRLVDPRGHNRALHAEILVKHVEGSN